jgi:esterase/lipase
METVSKEKLIETLIHAYYGDNDVRVMADINRRNKMRKVAEKLIELGYVVISPENTGHGDRR